jgi:hypothetical protein
MYTYVQTSKLVNRSIHTIRNTVFNLNLERRLIKGVTHLTKDGVETLENYFSPKTLKNSRIKIRFIENYLKNQSCRSASRNCGISKVTGAKILGEWERNDDCIIVDSSMNFTANKIQNKGIFLKGAKWGYCFVDKKVKHYKSGFTTEAEAVEALYTLKETLK